MALQRGNRTYYNPVHGVEWRDRLIPFNTLYALLAFCLLVLMAIILKVCYMGYRAEIHRLENKKVIKNTDNASVNKKPKGHPISILKTANGIKPCSESNKTIEKDLKVKFIKGERSDVELCRVGDYKQIDCDSQSNDSWNDSTIYSCHL